MPDCDLKITGAKVLDGSGSPGVFVDVIVNGDIIEEVGDCSHRVARENYNASGMTLAPGFIDVHTHDDFALAESHGMECKLSQGVTTVIAGNCGISAAPLSRPEALPPPFPLLGGVEDFRFPEVDDYRQHLVQKLPATNVALLTGHSSLRLDVMPDRLTEAACEKDINAMREKLDLALKQGCIGLSTGLDYPPAAAATTEEVIKVAAVLKAHAGAVYTSHMRDEGDKVLEAVRETLDIGRAAEVPVIISHHKCAGPQNYGKSRSTLAEIDEARSRDMKVSMDVYPYTASSSSLLPHFVQDSEAVLIAESEPYPQYSGRYLDDVAKELGCDMQQAAEMLYPASAVYFQMSEQDVDRIISHPATMIGSDGIPGMDNPHPRLWGTFPRVLGHYVRRRNLLSLEEAVHKMTGLSAGNFGLEKRGGIVPGYVADMVLFNADEVIDRGDYHHPEQVSAGIEHVWVNGESAFRNGAVTGRRAGRFLASGD